MKYNIPIIWSCWAVLEIEARTLEEAKELALIDSSLPNGEYIDDSIVVDEEGIDIFNPLLEL